MTQFIDDGDNDSYDRLHLMLERTSELLPGTEVDIMCQPRAGTSATVHRCCPFGPY